MRLKRLIMFIPTSIYPFNLRACCTRRTATDETPFTSLVRRNWVLKQPLNKLWARLHDALGCIAKNQSCNAPVSSDASYIPGIGRATAVWIDSINLEQLTLGPLYFSSSAWCSLGSSYYCILLLFPLSFRIVFLNAIRTSGSSFGSLMLLQYSRYYFSRNSDPLATTVERSRFVTRDEMWSLIPSSYGRIYYSCGRLRRFCCSLSVQRCNIDSYPQRQISKRQQSFLDNSGCQPKCLIVIRLRPQPQILY